MSRNVMSRLQPAIVVTLGAAMLAARCLLACSSSNTVHTQGGKRNTFADLDASHSDGSTGSDNNSGNLFGGGPPPPVSNPGHGNNGSGDGGGDDAGAFGRHDYPDATFDYTPPIESTDACAAVQAGATLSKRPVDIIISIDNSGSMAGEIQAVIDRINVDFAQIIENSGIDYRVIMVSRYGDLNFTLGDTNFSVCIGPPLGNANCPTNPAPALVNTARFFHHSTDIGSYNMWCRLLESYVTTDEYPESRAGWTPLAP
ncbi:MAG TPA: hypothetical protein VL137_16230, partial [Polyangiaceae bacterium]|nr:hypothetical protein [Polyangiaceae bacterium]